MEGEGGEFRGGLRCLQDTQAQALSMPPLPESSEDVTSVHFLQLLAAAASGGQMKPHPPLGDLRYLKRSLNSCDGVTNTHMLVGPSMVARRARGDCPSSFLRSPRPTPTFIP